MTTHAVDDSEERSPFADGDGDTILVLFAIPEKAQIRVLDLQGSLRHAGSHVKSSSAYITPQRVSPRGRAPESLVS
jgi:hypothetical protein